MTRLLLALMLFSALTGSARADSWALLVGVSRYHDRQLRSLPTVEADVALLAQALQESWKVPESHITILTPTSGTMPTRANILSSFLALKRKVRPGDRVFVYLAGHGVKQTAKTYLLPQDVRPDNQVSALETSIGLDFLTRTLGQLPGASLCLVWDIWQGSVFRREGKLPSIPPTKEEWSKCTWGRFLPEPGQTTREITEIYACTPEQKSHIWDDKNQSYFAYYLAQGLRSQTDFPAIADFVIKGVSAQVQQDEGLVQTPYVRRVTP